MYMDVSTVRNRLFTGFKPKEQDIATPYLGDLDGELKLVGLSGQQRIDLEEQATEPDGKVSFKKFTALCLAACLRLRSTGESIFTPIDTLGPSGNGDGLAAEMDNQVYISLSKQVAQFVGGQGGAQATKNDSEQTSDALPASSLPQDSVEPSASSSTELIAQS